MYIRWIKEKLMPDNQSTNLARLTTRFQELNAPDGFRPDLTAPLRWRCFRKRPDCVAIFDPSANTGFVLRVLGEAVDIAFHLDGRLARMMVDRKVIEDVGDQEKVLSTLSW
jgi:hypothetical protein